MKDAFAQMRARVCVCLCVYMSAYLSVCLSLSPCPSVCWSVCTYFVWLYPGLFPQQGSSMITIFGAFSSRKASYVLSKPLEYFTLVQYLYDVKVSGIHSLRSPTLFDVRDFTGLFHWFPVATERIVGPSPKVNRCLYWWLQTTCVPFNCITRQWYPSSQTALTLWVDRRTESQSESVPVLMAVNNVRAIQLPYQTVASVIANSTNLLPLQ